MIRTRRSLSRIDLAITFGFLVAALGAVWLATLAGGLAIFSVVPQGPVVQTTPLEVEQYLRGVGASFEIRAAPVQVAVNGQTSVSAVESTTGIRSSRASAVHGHLFLPGQDRRGAWLVVLDGLLAQQRVRAFGLVDASTGSVIWAHTAPIP